MLVLARAYETQGAVPRTENSRVSWTQKPYAVTDRVLSIRDRSIVLRAGKNGGSDA